MPAIHLAALVEGVQTRRDRTLKIIISSQELSPEAAAQVLALNQKQGWVMFSLNPMSETDIPEEPAMEFREEKSPSRRLKAVFFRLWEQEGKAGEFESYYRQKIEKLIDHYKEKLA